jgi:hypothetical protein
MAAAMSAGNSTPQAVHSVTYVSGLYRHAR